jgi:hypothetical protein
MFDDDLITFADISFGNLTEDEARFVQASTPEEAKAHVKPGMQDGFYIVLVEDLSIPGARDLLTALTRRRATTSLSFPDVPDWRDIRTGSASAWASFAQTHNITYPADAPRERIASAVRSWLEKNR